MNQNNIRDYNNEEYDVAEGAAIIKELNDRTVHDEDGYNSIAELGAKVKSLNTQTKTGTTIVLSKSRDQYNHTTPLGAGAYVLEGAEIGDEADVVINASTEPTFSHGSLTVIKSATSLDFEADTDLQAFFIVNANGIRYFYVKY